MGVGAGAGATRAGIDITAATGAGTTVTGNETGARAVKGAIATSNVWGYSNIAPLAASTPKPMRPPAMTFPKVVPWNLDSIVSTRS